jgi:hypothetical protein
MIAEEGIDDPGDWVTDHPELAVPGESALGPMITFSRMCRLYADMLLGVRGDPSNLRLLQWLEMDCQRWKSRWIDNSAKYGFLRQQMSLFKACYAFFRFHIAEYRLLYMSRFKSRGARLEADASNDLTLAFADCADAALGVVSNFQTEFVAYDYLPVTLNLVWVSLAVNSVWLIKVSTRRVRLRCRLIIQNLRHMIPTDRDRIIHSLLAVQTSTGEASRSSDDMAAYIHRLLKHMFSMVPSEWQSVSTAAVNPPPPSIPSATAADYSAYPNPFATPGDPAYWSSAQEFIQDQLWHVPPNHVTSAGMGEMQPRPALDVGPNNGGHVNMDWSEWIFPPGDEDIWWVRCRELQTIADQCVGDYSCRQVTIRTRCPCRSILRPEAQKRTIIFDWRPDKRLPSAAGLHHRRPVYTTPSVETVERGTRTSQLAISARQACPFAYSQMYSMSSSEP